MSIWTVDIRFVNIRGTDLLDENIARYKVFERREKWWWRIFTSMFDGVIDNTGQINKKSMANLVLAN